MSNNKYETRQSTSDPVKDYICWQGRLSFKEFTKRRLPWTIPGIIHDMPAWGGQCQHNGSFVTDINLEAMQINKEIGLDWKRDIGMVVFFSFG